MGKMENHTVRLLEIERFAIHDGPGIRTVVFLQGCPLRCPWCANPESQAVGNHLLHYEKKCVRCGSCVKACPHGYISFKEGRLTFERRDCVDCNLCMEACPQSAIKMAGVDIGVDEIMKTVLRDKDYYLRSGGGVTFSGGEALMQIDGMLSLLKQCKENGIHTAVETCGQVPCSHIEKVLPWVDLFLFDIKHTDAKKLELTVKGNLDLMLKNLYRIAQANPQKVVIRVPCIPDFNLSFDFFDSVFGLAKLLHISRVDLLPYHTLGKDKYLCMGLPYPYLDKALDGKELVEYRNRGRDMGLNVCIGG